MSTFFIVAAIAALAVIAFAVERVAAGALGRMRHRNAVNELMRLDDRMLADIGLHRCEIMSAVIEADDVRLPRERRHARGPEAPRQASWQGGTVRPLKAVAPIARPANDPTEPRRSA